MHKIAVLDFGGQYAHLIANRVRRLGVYSEILDGECSKEDLAGYKGVILSGGPSSVNAEVGPKCDTGIFDVGVPILGICYGHQLTAWALGGKVEKGHVREYGQAQVRFSNLSGIFEGVKESEPVWMSHFDQVVEVPSGFEIVASTEDCPIAAMVNNERKIYCIQFHPEVTHTPCGMTILENFIKETGAQREWSIDSYIEQIVDEIKVQVGDRKVFLMISGGVDSTVAFLLLDKALGQDKVYGLFVDTGYMRMGEREEVEQALKAAGVQNLHVYDASKEYIEALKDAYEPEEKRKIIGDLFLEIQRKVSDDLGLDPDHWMLGQGTIYPDTIETGGTKHADKIKTHHNRVEQIQKLIDEGKVIEPIAQLYKDEVRMVGEKLGLAANLVQRHPFPGPGLAVRMLCTKEADFPDNVAEVEKELNEIVDSEGLRASVLPIKSVGVQGDERTYKHPAVVYGKRIGWDRLSSLSTQVTNQVVGVNRVVYGLGDRDYDVLSTHDLAMNSERILTIQRADKIVMDYLKEANIMAEIWQFPTVLLPVSVGSQEGESLVLRPVCSEEAMTANFYEMDWEKLVELERRLMEVPGITAVMYDITNKPPGTIEWE